MLSDHLILCTPFFCLQSFPASGSFLMSWLFAPCGQSIGASTAASVLLMNIQGWFSLRWTGWSPCSPRDSQHHKTRAPILLHSAFFMVQLSLPYMATGKTIVWLDRPLSAKWCLCFSVCCPSLSYLSFQAEASFNFMTAVMVCSNFVTQENKICHCFYFSPFFFVWSDGTRCQDLHFLNVEFQASFFTLLFHPLKRLFRYSSLPAVRVVRLLKSLMASWFQLVIYPAWHVAWCPLHIS